MPLYFHTHHCTFSHLFCAPVELWFCRRSSSVFPAPMPPLQPALLREVVKTALRLVLSSWQPFSTSLKVVCCEHSPNGATGYNPLLHPKAWHPGAFSTSPFLLFFPTLWIRETVMITQSIPGNFLLDDLEGKRIVQIVWGPIWEEVMVLTHVRGMIYILKQCCGLLIWGWAIWAFLSTKDAFWGSQTYPSHS